MAKRIDVACARLAPDRAVDVGPGLERAELPDGVSDYVVDEAALIVTNERPR